MKDKAINICFVTDNNYVQHTLVALVSMYVNKFPSTKIKVFVICDNVGSEKRKMLMSFKRPDFDVVLVDYDNTTYAKKEYELGKYISSATYIRLKLPTIFKNLSRILYLDGDIIVQDDLSQLYWTDMDGKTIAGVPDCGVLIDSVNWKYVDYVRETLPNYEEEYVNAGVILMNLDRMRETDFENTCQRLYETRTDFIFSDQDILNFATQNEKKLLPIFWNCPIFSFQMNYGRHTKESMLDKIHEIYHISYDRDCYELVHKASILHLNGDKKHTFETAYLGAMYERYLKLALEYVKEGMK